MKKTVARVLTLVLACVLALSLAACGGSGKFASVEDFVNSEEIQAEVTKMQEEIGEGLITMAVKGEGSKMIYEFTYTVDVGDVDAVAAGLEQSMDAQAAVFENVASSLKQAVKVKDPVVVVRYLAQDGKELYSREFSAK